MSHPSDTTAPPSETVDVTVVVTLFNEQATVAELARRAVAALEPLGRSFELIFVDDGSTDGSFLEVERLAAADPRIRGVRFKRNFGQHPAMHAGQRISGLVYEVNSIELRAGYLDDLSPFFHFAFHGAAHGCRACCETFKALSRKAVPHVRKINNSLLFSR